MNLQIQCPKCSKRFTVHEDLTGKTVECGACDHRFPVKSESIIVERAKFYPGEQRSDFLDRLGKNPVKGEGGAEDLSGTGEHNPQVDAIMPPSPGQSIAVASGASLIILYGLVFFVGTSPGSVFQDVEMNSRLILGGFIGLLGAGLILFGAKSWRVRATLLSLVLLAGLFTLIFIRQVHVTPAVTDVREGTNPLNLVIEDPLAEEDIKTRVGYHAMERKIRTMSELEGSDQSNAIVGIFIEDLSGAQFHNLENYLKKVLALPVTEGIARYPRNNERDSLIVISGIELDFDTVVRHCDPRLGRATTYPELRLIDLKMSSTTSSEPSEDLLEKMKDPYHPAFFSVNLDEMRELDTTRVKNAVSRLANIPVDVPLRHEEKIIEEFMNVLTSETDPVLLSDLGRALRIWAGNNQACVNIASRNVVKWIDNDTIVPASFIDYLIENKAEKVPLIVDKLWGEEPEKWFNQYVALGPEVEPRILFHLEESPARLKYAAAELLAKMGTEKALPVLEKYLASIDSELKIRVERAIEGIKSR